MTKLPIPNGAVGKPGMLAMLQRVQGIEDGKMAAVRTPVGFVTSLVGSLRPVFAWQVLLLGEPVPINGKPCREVIVADRCLRPVSQITQAELEVLAKMQAQVDFDAALQDLGRIIGAQPASSGPELDAMIEKAAQQVGIQRALEVVPIAAALAEVGFKPAPPPNGESLVWTGVHEGTEIEMNAGPNWFDRWAITAKCVTVQTAMWDERTLPAELPRGEAVAALLEFWRNAFDRHAPTPDVFEIGLIYQQTKEEMRRLAPGLPQIQLDGEIFRATRRWILARHSGPCDRMGPEADAPMALSCEGGLLTIRTQGAAYGCPIHSGWIDECTLSFRSFLAVPAWGCRGWSVTLTATMDGMWIGAWHVPASRLPNHVR